MNSATFTTVRLLHCLRRSLSGPMKALRVADLDFVDTLDDVHAKIDAPLMCVWGDRDPFFPVDDARAMVANWPGEAQIEVIAGKRLFVHEEAPDVVGAHRATFLRKHTAVASPTSISA